MSWNLYGKGQNSISNIKLMSIIVETFGMKLRLCYGRNILHNSDDVLSTLTCKQCRDIPQEANIDFLQSTCKEL